MKAVVDSVGRIVVPKPLRDALAAAEHEATLATRDARAKDTYERIGVNVVVAG